jgi:hypothetical protein
LEIDELCACFLDWQKAFEPVKWTKLMHIAKKSGIDWCERRLISRLYMDQSVKKKKVRKKANWIGHISCRNCILKHVEGKVGGVEVTRRLRRWKQLLDD